jgi:hypothetical protein
MRCASLLETVTEKSATPVLLAAIKGRRTMKYICLGYYDKSKHEAITEAEKQAMFDTCFIYDDHLRANGHWGSGELLQPAETALTLYLEERQSRHDGRSQRTVRLPSSSRQMSDGTPAPSM